MGIDPGTLNKADPRVSYPVNIGSYGETVSQPPVTTLTLCSTTTRSTRADEVGWS
jgi:hypothetical protein